MSTKYYIAADGGGSKLLAILYDDNFNVIRHCKLSGVNARFKPIEAVRSNLSQMLAELLRDDIKEVESADLCLVCNEDIWGPIIRDDPRIKSVTCRDEPAIALGAAFMRDGIVALSGTGSDVFMMENGKRLGAVGGWGPLLGDEGSGYDIGLHAIKAAIKSYDGRGEKTMLLDLVLYQWQAKTLWDVVFSLASDPEARHKVASAAGLAGTAASKGDRVAQDIYYYAANELLSQTHALIRKIPERWGGNAVIMGGAWKSYHGMFDRYKSEMERIYPNANVVEPIFEPVVGCAVCRCFDEGIAPAVFEDKITRGFAEFLYKKI